MAIDEHDETTEDLDLSLREELEARYDEATEPESEDAVASTAETIGEGRDRDEKGRFAKKSEPIGDEQPEAQPDAAAVQQPGPEGQLEAEAEAPQQQLRAPQSWKPGAREHWEQLPDSVKEEVYRREHGMQQYLSQTAEERKLAQAFQQVYQPYEAMLHSEQMDPLQAVDELLATSYQLRVAPPAQKANIIANIIRQFGVDVQALDQALVGGPQQQQAPQQGPYQDPRVDNILQALAATKQQSEAKREQAAHQELQNFAQDHEFLPDVREHMADLMEVAERRGIALSLEDAYNQACRLNPEIASVMEQRQRAQAATQTQSRTARARAAASSVGGAPTKAPRKDPSELSIREAALQAFEEHAGG